MVVGTPGSSSPREAIAKSFERVREVLAALRETRPVVAMDWNNSRVGIAARHAEPALHATRPGAEALRRGAGLGLLHLGAPRLGLSLSPAGEGKGGKGVAIAVLPPKRISGLLCRNPILLKECRDQRARRAKADGHLGG
jgi:hypothetical protein